MKTTVHGCPFVSSGRISSMWRFGQKSKERELEKVMEQRFQELQERLRSEFEQLANRHDKAAMASENIRKALEQETDWKLVPADGFYRQATENELRGVVFLPLAPDYDLTLRITNKTYNLESAISLVVSRKFMPTRKHTLDDGQEVLIVRIDRELAPRRLVEALHTLLTPKEAGVWLDVQKVYQDESSIDQPTMQQVAIISYPLRRDISFDADTQAWSHANELYFDYEQPFCNVLPYPLDMLTPKPFNSEEQGDLEQ